MWGNTYCVKINGQVKARGLTLKNAIILVKDIFKEYYKEIISRELDSNIPDSE